MPHKKVITQMGKDLKGSFSSLQSTPGLVIAKDLGSRYSVISNDYATLLGWKNADACADLTDYDIPSHAVNAAEQFVALDQKVIVSGIAVTSLYICHYAHGWKVLLSNKTPIQKEDGEMTGVFGQVLDISNTHMYNWYLSLNYHDLKFAKNVEKPTIYILNQEHSPLPISPREQMCLFLLIRGKSMKEIGAILQISARTVEKNFEYIKIKLGCNSKSQLIELAITSGFIHYIPEEISARSGWDLNLNSGGKS